MELLAVLAVLAIMLVLVFPSFTDYLIQSRRADALFALTVDQNQLERCHAHTFSYKSTCTGLSRYPHPSPQGYYQIALNQVSTDTFLLTATASGPQTVDRTCYTISVNQANQKRAVDNEGLPQAMCWNR